MENSIKLLMNHRSVRDFANTPVEKSTLKQIIQCAQHAATSEFIQTHTIINITDQHIRKEIFDTVTKQKTIVEAPVFLMFCVDVSRLERACIMNYIEVPESYIGYTETFLMASADVAIAAQNAMAAAELMGLGGTYIGGIRNNPRKISQLLKLPKGVYPIFGMVLGYPGKDKEYVVKPRLPLSVVFKENSYNMEGDEELLREYDAVIKNYYIARTGGERSETWTEQMSDFVRKPQRPFLKEFLEEQGFLLK